MILENILYVLDILNSLPTFDSFEKTNFLVCDTLKKINAILENACEYYKIYQQSKIHHEINEQIYVEDENEFLEKSEEKLDFTDTSENKKSILPHKDTFQVADEVSNDLAKLISEFEKKEKEIDEEVKKKIVNQAKNNHENKLKAKDNNFKKEKKKNSHEQANRLNEIFKISIKKPEVESIIKHYLNKSGEILDKQDGPNLLKSQKIVEEDIKKTKKNIQELAQKANKIVWQEEREVLNFINNFKKIYM